ncbi:DgyrCDS1094 [Dimorphilus gyrociliatus]|uniref:DgyrCDS1094 n=1 Tax=Dimorphilus gyrociliatus TaxID=2664684 RepID=A0A7I8V6F7_9ANNE|nr:DgyrCDS1094 [Dimorphilus gyrociliatus]
MFICNENEKEGRVKMIREVRENTNRCYFLFEFQHQSLCSAKSFSVGLILVLILFSLGILYILCGVLYRRCIAGAKGWDQMPNYEFWTDFGNLQADGCNLICRRKQPQSNYYRGIGDEQLEKSEDIERDDHLLPI